MYAGIFKKENVLKLLMVVLLFAAFTSSVNVEAKKKSRKMKLNKTQVTAYVGMSPVKLKVKNLKAGKAVTWKSSKPNVATVAATPSAERTAIRRTFTHAVSLAVTHIFGLCGDFRRVRMGGRQTGRIYHVFHHGKLSVDSEAGLRFPSEPYCGDRETCGVGR